MIELGRIHHVFFQVYPNSEEIKSCYGQVSVLFSLPIEWHYLTSFQRKAILVLLQSNRDSKLEEFARIQYYNTEQLMALLKQNEVNEILEQDVLPQLGIVFCENHSKGYSFRKRMK